MFLILPGVSPSLREDEFIPFAEAQFEAAKDGLRARDVLLFWVLPIVNRSANLLAKIPVNATGSTVLAFLNYSPLFNVFCLSYKGSFRFDNMNLDIGLNSTADSLPSLTESKYFQTSIWATCVLKRFVYLCMRAAAEEA